MHRRGVGKTYLHLPRRLQSDVEIPPQFLDFATFDHHVDNLVRVFGLLLLAPVAALEDPGVGEDALTGEIVDDPLVEVESPVDECVGHCCFGFTVPGTSNI